MDDEGYRFNDSPSRYKLASPYYAISEISNYLQVAVHKKMPIKLQYKCRPGLRSLIEFSNSLNGLSIKIQSVVEESY